MSQAEVFAYETSRLHSFMSEGMEETLMLLSIIKPFRYHMDYESHIRTYVVVSKRVTNALFAFLINEND